METSLVVGEISTVEEMFKGVKYKEDEIRKVLDNIDIEYYFAKINKEELLDCII